jgi:hypothetical protein
VLTADPEFGELDAGGPRIMVSREAMVPRGRTDGVILHHYVDDVAAAVEQAVEAGAELLAGPLRTDLGNRACLPEGTPVAWSSISAVMSSGFTLGISWVLGCRCGRRGWSIRASRGGAG